MTTTKWLQAGLGALMLGALSLPVAGADFELKDGQGRRILLKDDGTWRYAEAPPPGDAASAPARSSPRPSCTWCGARTCRAAAASSSASSIR